MRSGVAERTFGCIASVADICFGSSKVKPAIRTNHAHIDNLDVSRLFRFVAGKNRIRRRLTLEQIDALSAENHRTRLVAVHEESVLCVDPGYNLRRHDLRPLGLVGALAHRR